jgi:sec-independent protein translocase protein TatB
MLSIPHLIIVFIVALVVFGPEKLPELARNLGKIMGEFKRATGDLRSTFEGHMRDLEREADQRRMRVEAESATTPTVPSAAAPSDLSPSPPAPGSIPTTPPHLLGVNPLTEAEPSPLSPAEHSRVNDGAIAEVATTDRPVSSLEPEHNPETLTDAGIHPA